MSPEILRKSIEASMKNAPKDVIERVVQEKMQNRPLGTISDDPELQEKAEEAMDASTTSFLEDEQGLWVRAFNFGSMLKEVSRIARIADRRRGEGIPDALRIATKIYPYRVRLLREGKLIKVVDGFEDRAIHVRGPAGNRTAIKRRGFVNTPTLQFVVWTCAPVVTTELIRQLFDLAQHTGLGTDRTSYEGQFVVEEITELDAGEIKKLHKAMAKPPEQQS